MKVLTCVLAFVATAHGGLLSHLEAPESSPSLPHATLPTAPLQIFKIIHEAAGDVVNIAAPAAAKIIKVIHESHSAPAPESPTNIVKVIHQAAPAPVQVASSGKLLKVVHEYAPRHYAPAPEVQSTKVLKIINQQAATPHPVSTAQNVRVFKVIRQAGASHGAGQTYASGYGHGRGHATPGSAVKHIKVLPKTVLQPTW